MSDPTNPNPPKKHGCFYYGCLTAVLGFFAFVGLMVAFFFYGRSVVGPVADNYLQHVDKNEYAQAYAAFTDGKKQMLTLAEFTTAQKNVQSVLGAVKDKTLTGVSMKTDNSGTTAETQYDVTFAKGKATVTFKLVKEGGDWKIADEIVNSPLLQKGAAPAPAEDSPESPENEKPNAEKSDAAPEDAGSVGERAATRKK